MTTHHGSKFEQKRASILARRRFDGALSANSAFSNLINRKADQRDVQALSKDPEFNVVIQGAREYTLQHARWVHEGCKSDTYSLRDILRSQDMFLRSEVSTDEEMKVSGISRLWLRNGKNVITETRADVGLWQVGEDMRDWARQVGTSLVEKRDSKGVTTLARSDVLNTYWDNREYVADDPLILRRVLQLSARLTSTENGVIFTKDRVLVKMCANHSGMNFYRVSPSVLLHLVKGGDVRSKCLELDMNPKLAEELLKLPGNPVRISIVDTGSLDETLMNHERVVLSGKEKIVSRKRIDYGRNSRGRFEVFSQRVIDESTLAGIFNRTTKDDSGRPAFEYFKPQKAIRLKIPKFEAYRGSGTPSGSHLDGISEVDLVGWRTPRLPSEQM
jgi:hypothetical protein